MNIQRGHGQSDKANPQIYFSILLVCPQKRKAVNVLRNFSLDAFTTSGRVSATPG
jgi:hypothetical protein